MWSSLGQPISDCDHDTELFTASHFKGRSDLAVGHGHPAGVESQLLGQQHQPLSVVAAGLVQGGTFLSNHCDIVRNTAEFSIVGHKAIKGLRLVCDKLDM